MKKYILILLSVLMSISLIACSSSNIITENNTIAIKTISTTNSKWENKTYISIGDSITWQDKHKYYDSKTIARGYQTLLNEKINFKNIINCGINGATIAKSPHYPRSKSNYIDGLTRNFATADLVTIASGTNDFRQNVPLGKLGSINDKSFDDTTFYGAYRKLIEHILTSKPTIKLILFTPLQRNNKPYDLNYINSAGFKLIDYVDAIENIGKLYNLPILDLYSTSGIEVFNLNQYTRDGLHPNDSGYELISKPILDFIENN